MHKKIRKSAEAVGQVKQESQQRAKKNPLQKAAALL